jgi:hypothetical protein
MFAVSKSRLVAAIAASACAWTSQGMAQSISKSGSTLTVKGTTGVDNLTLTGSTAGAIAVLNNRNSQTTAFTGIQRINVDLLGGNDVLNLVSLDLNGGIASVKMGADNDAVTASGTNDASLSLDGELGNDDITVSGTVSGDVALYGGIRDDIIDVSGTTFDGDLYVDAQGGEDDVYYDGTTVFGLTHLDLGPGADLAEGSGALFMDDVEIIAGLEDDQVNNSNSTYEGNLFVDLRGGDDNYNELSSFVGGDYHIDGGPGTDHVDHTGTVVVGSTSTTSIE